jgi:N-acetylmuramoyl-L-alanine amidase
MHFIKKFSQFIFYILIVTAPLHAKAQEPKIIISKIEFLENKKLNITLDKITEYKIFTLSKPDRLSIEIKNAKLSNKDYAPKKPKYISKITFDENNQTLLINLFFQEKYLAKNVTFNKENKIISCDLEPKKSSSPQYSQNEKNTNDNSNAKTENIIKKTDVKKEIIKEDDQQKLIIKKTPNSIVKYKIRTAKPPSTKIGNEILPIAVSNDKKIAKSTSKPVIIIDAGHGGKDPGTIGVYARTKEKNITLSYAKELAKHLMNEKKYKVYLTRDDDFFIPLDKRVAKSRRKKADLFISLHANSIADKFVSGFSIYTLSDNSSDKQAELLAQKENQADIINGIDFSGASKDIMKTLIDLSQRESKNSSARFAKYVIRDIKKAEIEILQNTHRFAGFMVLTAPDMASVLIELGYLSNRREEEMLNSASYRRLIAKTLTNSINQYFKNFK